MATGFHITEVWAFIATGNDGDEGICGFHTGSGWIPMIAANQARIDSLKPLAKQLASISGPITLSRFSVREDIEAYPLL